MEIVTSQKKRKIPFKILTTAKLLGNLCGESDVRYSTYYHCLPGQIYRELWDTVHIIIVSQARFIENCQIQYILLLSPWPDLYRIVRYSTYYHCLPGQIYRELWDTVHIIIVSLARFIDNCHIQYILSLSPWPDF